MDGVTFLKWRMFLLQGSSKVFCTSTGIFHEIVCAFKLPSFENYSIIIWKPKFLFQDKLWDCQCNWVDITEKLSMLFLIRSAWVDWRLGSTKYSSTQAWIWDTATILELRECCCTSCGSSLETWVKWVWSCDSLVIGKTLFWFTHCKTIRYDFIALLIFAQKSICAGLALVQGSFMLWSVLRR